MDANTAPDYLRSADLHNIGAGNESFFSDPVAAIGNAVDATTNFIAKVPAFAVTSIASGINSIYNTGVVAGNFFGLTDAKENNIQSTLGSYDSDLGQYYNAHKSSTDLAGFVVTSLIPGTGGIKLFNTGQRVLSGAMRTGLLGDTLAGSTGLISTIASGGKSLTQIAGESLAQSGQTFSLLNAGVLKAIGGGVAQATLESAAFEAMVQATMFRSPILENQDIKDIGSNILTGALFGGAVGGLVNAAGVYGGVKRIVTAADAAQLDSIRLASTNAVTSPSSRIVIRAGDIQNLPDTADSVLTSLQTKTTQRANLDIRSDINELAGKDNTLGNLIADSVEGSSGDQIANSFSGVNKIFRPGFKPKLAEGEQLAFVKLTGNGGVGDLTFDAPHYSEFNLANRLSKTVGDDPAIAVNKFVNSQGFAVGKNWTIQGAKSLDEVEARYMWAEKNAVYREGMPINENDIPLLEGAVRNKLGTVSLTNDLGESTQVTGQSISDSLRSTKLRVAGEVSDELPYGWGTTGHDAIRIAENKGKNTKITSNEIAKSVNVDPTALESETTGSIFARQDAQSAFDESRIAAGKKADIDLDMVPNYFGATVDSTRAAHVTTDLVSSLVNVAQVQKVMRNSSDRAFANIAGTEADLFPTEFGSKLSQANRYGAGAGLISSSNATPGSLGSVVEYIGAGTAKLIVALKKATGDILDSPTLRIRNNNAAAVEFSALNDMRNSAGEMYQLNAAKDGLIVKRVAEYRAAIAEGKTGVPVPDIQAGVKEEVLFKNADAANAVIADIEANGRRVTFENTLRKAEGSDSNRDPNIFYGWRPDESKMKYFAIVKDETLTGTAAGQTSMIHAASESQLRDMINMVHEKTGFRAYTKNDGDAYFKARKEFEFDRSLHENYMDGQLKQAGVNNQFFPKTDPDAIANEWSASHSRRDSLLARDAVAVKYGDEFDQLKSMGEQFTNIAASQKGVTTKSVENVVQNPYNDYIKTAMNISRLGEYPLLSSVNRGLESATNYVVQNIADAWKAVKTVDDLPAINKLLADAGISHAYKNSAEVILANHTAPKPYLSDFIRNANSILTATFLKLDFLNPLNNAISAQVLLGHETSGMTKQLLRDRAAAGIVVPGTDDTILSPLRMIAKANKDWIGDTPELDALFKHQGLTSTMRNQEKQMLDEITLAGSETPTILKGKLQNALDISKQLTELGAKYTGNNLAEEYNRFVAAHVGQQIGNVRIANGLMTADDMGPFMNSFVNRTQSNSLASQRPLIFQGPVGQALGLFQSYQFNILQQLFRGVSEGGAKDAAMLLGLQGTIFGLNGLPAFQYINQHIVGTASGNKDHTDAYSALYGSAGKTAGDWLMYGVASNLLQTNLYSRGDINPRTITVIPTAPQDIVAVSAFSKFAANLKETVSKVTAGGDIWQSVLQGLEHNTLSRPLAGLAATLQAPTSGKAFSTTNAGDISFVNDFMSLATLSRLAGGKPLDEALANDEVARATVYKAADNERMKASTEVFKTSVIGKPNEQLDPTVVHNYMDAFLRNGGQAPDFNKNMLNALTRANTPRANQIISTLKGPYAQHMKDLMGGGVADLNSP